MSLTGSDAYRNLPCAKRAGPQSQRQLAEMRSIMRDTSFSFLFFRLKALQEKPFFIRILDEAAATLGFFFSFFLFLFARRNAHAHTIFRAAASSARRPRLTRNKPVDEKLTGRYRTWPECEMVSSYGSPGSRNVARNDKSDPLGVDSIFARPMG